jgi:DNA-binding NarL/FixJ family response regulator
VAAGDARAALGALREAETIWRELEAPYEAAVTRVLVGRACEELGDACEAELEMDAAASVFERLGAAPDLTRLARLRRPDATGGSDGLTGREVEVLRLVAEGKTNRVIAGQLGISEKTVARHLSNIFVKLGISSRSAATAYAYQHSLVHS